MIFLRRHWYDLGIGGVIFIIFYLLKNHLSNYEMVMWVSLATLLLHQFEEYRYPGTFLFMINSVIFKSENPDRYPLNTKTAFFINVIEGWSLYLFAAIFAERAVWLGIATIVISFGNIIAHTFLFNIKGKTFYNAGMVTCWLFFVPCVSYFFYIVFSEHIGSKSDFIVGILLGVVLNYFGIFKMISWMSDKEN